MESEADAENVARTDNGRGIKPFLSLSLRFKAHEPFYCTRWKNRL